MLEVVVVGGGMAGVATALALEGRGAAVNLVEAEHLAGAATGASAGMLAPQYESPGPGPLYRLGVRSRAMWPEFARRLSELAGVELPIRWDGMLVANLDDAEDAEARASVEWQRAAGQAAEVLSPETAVDLQDGLGADARSWLWLPDEGHVDAQALLEIFAAALRATSVRVLTGVRVRELAVSAGVVEGVVLDDDRRLAGDRVVLAAGAWTGGIGGVLRPVPVHPVRGQMLRFDEAPEVRRLIASHAGRYIVPRDDGTVLVGSTMEEVGFDRSITGEGAERVLAACRALLPALGERRFREQWADLRPMTPDGLPVLGADPDLAGLYYATGHGRNGILLGPVTGEIMAGLVLDGAVPPGPGTTPDDLAALAPGRFRVGG